MREIELGLAFGRTIIAIILYCKGFNFEGSYEQADRFLRQLKEDTKPFNKEQDVKKSGTFFNGHKIILDDRMPVNQIWLLHEEEFRRIFNTMFSQYTTLEEARTIANSLYEIGGGVLPYNSKDNDKSGIYIPEYTTGPFMTPSDGDKKFYHFRFKNRADGINAGLVKSVQLTNPTRWPMMIALDVAQAVKPPTDD